MQNPFNPLMFVKYDQTNERSFKKYDRDGFLIEATQTDQIKRTIYLEHTFSKFKDEVPTCNVLFIGEPVIGKSGLISDMLNVDFEERS